MHTEKIPLNKIELNTGQIPGLPKNPRFIKDARYKKLLQSLQELPSMMDLREVIVFPFGDRYVAIGGNMRVRACNELKWDEVPCKVLDIETPVAVLKEIAIKDNNGYGEDDWSALITDWDVNDLINWGVEVPEMEKPLPEASEDNYEIKEGLTTDIVAGDLFEIGEHRLLCGDSTDYDSILLLMNGHLFDLYFTDPPYSVNFTKKAREVLKSKNYNEIVNDNLSLKETADLIWKPSFKNAFAFAKDDCSFYVTMPQGGDQMMMMMMSEKWQVKHELIWVKEAPVFSMGRLDYDYKHEPIMYGWKKKHNFYGKGAFLKSVWEIPRKENKLHPTMKPIALIENSLKNSTLENNIVFDSFLGSGSTMVAAHQLKRRCFGVEMDVHYCQVIVDRMLALDPSLVVKKNGEPYVPATKGGK